MEAENHAREAHITQQQAHALRSCLECACRVLPRAMQSGFIAQGLMGLKLRFSCELDQIPAEQYCEAIEWVSDHIQAARRVAEALPVALPWADAAHAQRAIDHVVRGVA